jgi:hypothetical protein
VAVAVADRVFVGARVSRTEILERDDRPRQVLGDHAPVDLFIEPGGGALQLVALAAGLPRNVSTRPMYARSRGVMVWPGAVRNAV